MLDTVVVKLTKQLHQLTVGDRVKLNSAIYWLDTDGESLWRISVYDKRYGLKGYHGKVVAKYTNGVIIPCDK
ncbi:MAG: hypothetical protein RR573_08080 [Oscillospiraceae bacterium]